MNEFWQVIAAFWNGLKAVGQVRGFALPSQSATGSTPTLLGSLSRQVSLNGHIRRVVHPLARILSGRESVDRNAGLDPLQEDAEAGVEAPVEIIVCLVSRECPEDAARRR